MLCMCVYAKLMCATKDYDYDLGFLYEPQDVDDDNVRPLVRPTIGNSCNTELYTHILRTCGDKNEEGKKTTREGVN